MAERIREIRFKHFRGLPDYICKLDGKSIVICGGTGKGKSAIVDGIEFIFSGIIRRFHGEGSGNIDADDAIRHVHKKDIPLVEVGFTPTNATMKRRLGDEGLTVPERPTIKEYIERHPPSGSFILRRHQLLEFIYDQEAKRYQKYIRLLGLDSVDFTQKVVIEAEQNISQATSETEIRLQQLLQLFRIDKLNWSPRSSIEILTKCSELAQNLGCRVIAAWDQIEEVLLDLDAKRSRETKEKIDKLNVAIDRLSTNISTKIEEEALLLNQLHEQLQIKQAESVEAKKGEIIKEGIRYFQEYPDTKVCPLCERPLESGYHEVFENLKARDKALSELREREKLQTVHIDTLITEIQKVIHQLEQEEKDHSVYPEEQRALLLTQKNNLVEWIKKIKEVKERKTYEIIEISPAIQGIRSIRSSLYTHLAKERNELIKSDAVAIEETFSFLQRARDKRMEIESAETNVKKVQKILQQLQAVREAFSRAREVAIQQIFTIIAKKVISYYQDLHGARDSAENVECTRLTLTPTSRAAAGGLRLAIEFLGLTDACDPRMFLSEGHLDSLGLCLYLASARMFNPSGSLLVLDDILTSIDKEHRHRVVQLLLQEFSDFQIVLTTHDEYLFELIKSSSQARGEQSNWIFKQISRWTLDRGPESSAFEGTWDWIDANLQEDSYRQMGSALRVILEDFLKRVAEKIELKVRFHNDGKYTAFDFKHAGIDNEIREKLINKEPSDADKIRLELQRVFGTGDLINFLSHDNPGRLEVTLGEVKDFVAGLKELENRCKKHQIIKGHS